MSVPVRAFFPFTADASLGPSHPDGPSRVAASTFVIYPTSATTIQAMVAGIVSVDTSNSTIVLQPSDPLSLTGGLGRYGAVAIDKIVYGGVPIAEAAASVIVKADKSARNFIDAGPPPKKGTAVAEEWAAGMYGVYVEGGGLLWQGAGSATTLALTITLIVGQDASNEYQLDGRELLRAIYAAGAFDPTNLPTLPGLIFNDPVPSSILVIGPAPKAIAGTPIIETIACGATDIVVYGPASGVVLPPELVYLGPSSGDLDITLSAGTSADWTADASGVSLGSATATTHLKIDKIPWATLPDPSVEAVPGTITAAPDLSITVMGLKNPPVIDTGRAARASVPLEGSPRVSIRVSDCDSPPAAFDPAATVAEGSEPMVSPDGQRLYFTVSAGAEGTVNLNITNGASTVLVSDGLTYVEDISEGFEGLKAALAIAAEEAAELAQDASLSDLVAKFCTTFRPRVLAYQMIVADMLGRITAPDVAVWQQLMADQAQLVIDTVNEAVATLNHPPVASFDGQPFASADDEPDCDIGAYVIMMTALDCVVVRSSIDVITEA